MAFVTSPQHLSSFQVVISQMGMELEVIPFINCVVSIVISLGKSIYGDKLQG